MSSGLAKTLSSQDESFDYPALNIAELEKENSLPAAFHTSSRTTSGSLASVLFDEDDFDSDIDLDVEDPATKGTVSYPTLPQVASTSSTDSGYQTRPQTTQVKAELASSQPIPWSSSPLEHFKTPQKVAPPQPKPESPKLEPKKSKRAKLPWPVESTQVKALPTPEPEELEDVQHKKRKSTEATQREAITPSSKDVKKDAYVWNTTPGALKQQQKNLREQHKQQTKANKGTVDDVSELIKQKKKNSVHRIFLSEEQTNVLNLVVEYKKSVFFTGSAGRFTLRNVSEDANHCRYW